MQGAETGVTEAETSDAAAVAAIEPSLTPPPEPSPTLPPEVEATPTEAAVVGEQTPAQPTTAPEPAATPHPAEALIAAFNGPSQTNGEVLILYGQVLDVNGDPVEDAVVEIWQTDENGIYDHPDDPTTAGRDLTFQFFGQTAVDDGGWYAFRTILPGEYEPRPRHIHYKVKLNGTTLLTSQFYFSDDIAKVEGEGMFRAVGESADLLLLQLVAGDETALANGRIVVDTGLGAGELALTPSQTEGPFYPVVSLAGTDNDLTQLP
jgi:protocatechuate 3,4-dioxygenase beta subunit